MCVVSIISGLSECMLEETVYTMLFRAKTQTKIQNVSQGGEPLHSWVLRAFIVHWQNGPRYCQCHWWKWATAALQQEGRPGGEGRHTFQPNKLPLQLVVSGWLVRQRQKHTEGHFKIQMFYLLESAVLYKMLPSPQTQVYCWINFISTLVNSTTKTEHW